MQDFRVARRAMVDSQLRPQGVTNRSVLAAMAELPREDFVPEGAKSFAYFDRPVRLGQGRSMMPPAALGRLLSELAPAAGDKALVVGAGTGYSAALLTAMGVNVVAVEQDAALAALAKAAGVDLASGDLPAGHAKHAPYDLILIDGAVEDVPAAIVKQLADNGRLGTAILDRGVSRLAVGRKISNGFGLTTVVDADVAPLPGFERPQVFSF